MLSFFNRRRGVAEHVQPTRASTREAASKGLETQEESADTSWVPPQISAAYSHFDIIGEGTYGVVYKAIRNATNDMVALKKIKLSAPDSSDAVASMGVVTTAIREVMLLRELRHPNLVTLHDSIFVAEKLELWLAFEFCPTDLRQFVKYTTKAKRSLSRYQDERLRNVADGLRVEQIRHFFRHIAEATAFCHGQRVLHRDLKPQNILLSVPDVNATSTSDEEQDVINQLKSMKIVGGDNICHVLCNWRIATAKLADLGLARACELPNMQLTQEVVTLWYRAPELLLGAPAYAKSVDVWSLGCILGEMISGRAIFPGDSEVDTLFKIFQLLGTPDGVTCPTLTAYHHFKPAFPKWPMDKALLQKNVLGHLVDPLLLDLVDRMLRLEPSERMSAADILKHPWFDQK